MVDEHSAVLAQNYALGVSVVGFFLYPFFNRCFKKQVKQICIAALAIVAVCCVLLMEQRLTYDLILFPGMGTFLILGLFGGATYHLAASMIETDRYLARQVGIAYAMSILLQFANNNLVHSDLIEMVILSIFLLGLVVLLVKTEQTLDVPVSSAGGTIEGGAVTTGKFAAHRSNEAITGVLLALLVALMACIFSTLDNAVTLEHAAGKTDIGQWPRILLACSGLIAGFIFDIKRRDFMNIIMFCVMMLSTIGVAILQLGGSFLIGLIIFYLSSGFFVVFFTSSFMELSYHMRVPELWAGMGRTANNICTVFITSGSLALINSRNSIMEIALVLILFVAVSIVMAVYIAKRKAVMEDLNQGAAIDVYKRQPKPCRAFSPIAPSPRANWVIKDCTSSYPQIWRTWGGRLS